MSLEGKVAIVTGASSGIGEAIAVLFVEHKCKVVVTGRREDRLAQLVQKLGDANALSVVCDAQVRAREHSHAGACSGTDPMWLVWVRVYGGWSVETRGP